MFCTVALILYAINSTANTDFSIFVRHLLFLPSSAQTSTPTSVEAEFSFIHTISGISWSCCSAELQKGEKILVVLLKSGQVCKKWLSWCTDHSGKRWAISIFPFKMIQRGDHWMIFSQFRAGWNSTILLVFYIFITSSPLTRIFQPHKIVLFDPVHVLCQPNQHLDMKFNINISFSKNQLWILVIFHWLCSCLIFEGRRRKLPSSVPVPVQSNWVQP